MKAYIGNLNDFPLYYTRSYGHFTLHPTQPGRRILYHADGTVSSVLCELGAEYAVTELIDSSDHYDFGEDQKAVHTVEGEKIAADLCREDEVQRGFFICAGPIPTASEIAAATAARRAHYMRLVAQGDREFARTRRFDHVDANHRRAIAYLGVTREWAYIATEMMPCPACGEQIRKGVATCKHCSAIVDQEKYAQLSFVGAPPERIEPEPGFPGLSGPIDLNEPEPVGAAAGHSTARQSQPPKKRRR